MVIPKIYQTYLWIVFCSMTAIVHAQDIRFTLDVDRDSLKVGEIITLTYTLTGVQGSIRLPEFKSLNIVAGPNISSKMSIINGQVNQRMTQTVSLQATEAGACYIPPAKAVWEEGEMESSGLDVIILDDPDFEPYQLRPRRVHPSKKKNSKITQI